MRIPSQKWLTCHQCVTFLIVSSTDPTVDDIFSNVHTLYIMFQTIPFNICYMVWPFCVVEGRTVIYCYLHPRYVVSGE